MKKMIYLSLLASTLGMTKIKAQTCGNLIVNGDFETFSSCPDGLGQIPKAIPWNNTDKTLTNGCDYYNMCDIIGQSGTPGNAEGTQDPHAGAGYAGFVVQINNSEGREYIQEKLASPLVAGQQYLIKYYINFADGSGLATNKIGCYLSAAEVSAPGTSSLTLTPDFETGTGNTKPSFNFLNDKNIWVEVSQIYTPKTAGEQYIVIGNFRNNAALQTSAVSGGSTGLCYYFIDDVSVVPYTAHQVLGSANKVDTITGGMDFSGNYDIINTIVLKDGTYNLTECTTLFVKGSASASAYEKNVHNNDAIKSGYIYLLNADLNMNNATITALTDTMWGGIAECPPNNTYSKFTKASNVSIKGTNGYYSTISHSNSGVAYQSPANLPNAYPNSFLHLSVNHTKFLYNYYAIKGFKEHGFKDTVTNCIFDGDKAMMKAPLENHFGTSALSLYLDHSNTLITGNTINNVLVGVNGPGSFVGGEVFKANVTGNTFNNNVIAAMYMLDYGSGDTAIFADNTVNFPKQAYTGGDIPAGYSGRTVGYYTNSPGFRISGNQFNGSAGSTLTQQGVISAYYLDTYGYSVKNNKFSKLTQAVAGLNQHTQRFLYFANTFSNCTDAITIDKNTTGPTPSINIHCNNFSTVTKNGINAIYIPGKTGDIGSSGPGNATGNKYTGYNSGLDFAVLNNNASNAFTYWTSFNEKANIKFGPVKNVSTPLVGNVSGCDATGPGQAIIAIDQILQPAIEQVEIAIQRLKNNLALPAQVAELEGTIIKYYHNTCGAGNQYAGVVNSMLPLNKAAFTNLGFDLSTCYIANGAIAQAQTLMQQIVTTNPGNVGVANRVAFYNASINALGNNVASARQDGINSLISIAQGNSEYALTACYMLLQLAPDRTNNCFGNTAASTQREAKQAEIFTGIAKVAFSNAPNPFSNSTKISYSLSDDVQKASLKIYDLQGRLMRTQVLDIQATDVDVTVDGLADGVYIYTIETDGLQAFDKKRMVIIR